VKKRIFFRTDANTRIGYGHLSRCLILADELARSGWSITFLLRRTDNSARKEILDKDYGVFDLAKGSPREIIDRLADQDPESGVLVFDTDEKVYYEPENQQAFLNHGLKLVFFTFWDNHEYLAHIIINQNPMSLERKYKTADYTRKLLGPAYMIFSDDMVETSRSGKKNGDSSRSLLLAFGGSDQPDRTLKTLKALQKVDLDITMIHIVTGSLYPHEQRLNEFLAKFRYPCRLYRQTRDMPAIMASADLALCAGGLTLWELALFEVPTAIISWSDREYLTAEYLDRTGLGFHLGSIKNLKPVELSGKIVNFAGNREAGSRIRALRSRIDVEGKKKIAKEINHLIREE
jgi:UDP-2,4-diacetamido-2,4,6-trideoxy-beta-L-altropyranose hydrolase